MIPAKISCFADLVDKDQQADYSVNMLEQIRVKNFALIDDLTLEFHPRLNVFTGETGAGKTILIDALSAVLGERLDLVSLRLKEEGCLTEAVFNVVKTTRTRGNVFGAWFGEDAGKRRELEELRSLEAGREREIDLLKFQIGEISRVNPKPDEDAKLKEEHIRLANAEKLYEKAAHVVDRLSEGEGSAIEQIGQCSKFLSELAAIDSSLKPLTQEIESVESGLDEIARSVRDYQDSISFDADRLKAVEERIDALATVKRKYGGSLEAALTFLTESKKRLSLLENSEVRGKELEKSLAELETKVRRAGKKLSEERSEAAAKLKSLIERELKDLGIAHARFECRVEKSEPAETGCERVEFYISPNLGEEMLPLAKIISGGEASRVMLALKRALIDSDEIPTMIFDEIDTNIGGRLGSVVGEKLAEIAKKHQVLLVTHLPQIASFADQHIKVSKSVEGKRTKTHYAVIDSEARVRELAEMMAGEKKSEVATKHAREMLAAQR
ncbi:MAG: DNA repair protein RecN [Candidatus Omnitrophica bacterium]|nr:DNA repair protein RecN [Candidatus Omnitrophota bacterium]